MGKNCCSIILLIGEDLGDKEKAENISMNCFASQLKHPKQELLLHPIIHVYTHKCAAGADFMKGLRLSPVSG